MKLYLPSAIAFALFVHGSAFEQIPSINYNARKGLDSDPDSVKCKTWEEVYNDLVALQGDFTDNLRINSLVDCNQGDPVLQYATGIGAKLDLGISTSNGHDYFLQEKTKLGEFIDKGFIDDRVASLHIGNSAIAHGLVNVDTAISYLKDIREFIRGRGINASVTIADSIDVYNANPQLIDAVDFVSVNYFSFWEKADVNEGVAVTLDRLKSLRIAAANKG
ncbi:Glycoside hydrolase, partial [Phytophthora megakarya]